ncbi:MAG: PKD domain-containing protein [Bacteroidia bacterium]|nr:PKD domain-containing protein [Bacteroidia bacterium]
MKRFHFSIMTAILLISSVVEMYASGPDRASQSLANTGIRFQENRGQIVDSEGRARHDIAFIAEAPGVRMYFRIDGISYVFSETSLNLAEAPHEGAPVTFAKSSTAAESKLYRMDMTFPGSNPNTRLRVGDVYPGYVNYYLPHCPQGITGVKEYGRIVYENIYRHIDLELLSSGGKIKYNFVVRPGGLVSDIRMHYDGSIETALTQAGLLQIATPLGRIEEAAPYSYVGREENEVQSRFIQDGNTVGFEVDAYDRWQTLVIDPWATYYGGSAGDGAYEIVVDEYGNVIIAGNTSSLNLPVSTGLQTVLAGGSDAFVTKFDNAGQRVWATYYGGSGNDGAASISWNTNGKCTIVGTTYSSNLPGTSGSYQPLYKGNGDAYLAQFSSAGVLLWATYYGGTKVEQMPCAATDANGNIFLALQSGSKGMPLTPGVFSVSGGLNLVKFSESGTLLWATQHGSGTPWDGIATDVYGNILVTGMAPSGFPVSSGAWQSTCAGGNDAFILKYSGSGARLWSTYYGGSSNDWARGLATDGNGDVVITGYTYSTDLPVSPTAFQTYHAGGGMYDQDAYLAKFSASGQHLWSTYYGGSSYDYGFAVTTDLNNSITFAGSTSSAQFPVSPGAFQGSIQGMRDGFVVQFSSAGSRNWATFFGGSNDETVYGIVSDAAAALYFTGNTYSTDFPTLNPSQPVNAGQADAFIAQLNSSGLIPGYNAPPVAVMAAVPTQGKAPLAVNFSSAGSYDPDGTITAYSWDFGDGGSSNLEHPSHDYLTPGVYTAVLMVTDNGNATASASTTVTVTSASAYLYVHDQTVTRVKAGNKWKGRDLITIYDGANQPASGAVVTASYSGPNSGTATGTTASNGTVMLETAPIANPAGIWCFTVTNAQKSGYTYNSGIGVPSACEVAPKVSTSIPSTIDVSVDPNPFNPSTTLTYSIPDDGFVLLKVFNVSGQVVSVLVKEKKAPGTYSVVFNGAHLPSGLYLYRLEADDQTCVGRMILIK